MTFDSVCGTFGGDNLSHVTIPLTVLGAHDHTRCIQQIVTSVDRDQGSNPYLQVKLLTKHAIIS